MTENRRGIYLDRERERDLDFDSDLERDRDLLLRPLLLELLSSSSDEDPESSWSLDLAATTINQGIHISNHPQPLPIWTCL